MFATISGKLEDIDENLITINCGGVGYEIFASQTTLDKLGAIGDDAKVWTYLNVDVRDGEISLFGFSSREEKKMFLNLTSVSGIGPKTAITILGSVSVYDIASSIASGDAKVIARVKGLGKKSAERIVLELREKMEKSVEFAKTPLETNAELETEQEYAVNVLLSLGLSRFDAVKKIREVSASGDKAEDLVQKVLKNF
ncbi:MAG: Holliday junction branch migration protein RuvA [Clostridia bacterium]|nr:Holliday junction branch migration protein RuvA [Clostridia bacterium]